MNAVESKSEKLYRLQNEAIERALESPDTDVQIFGSIALSLRELSDACHPDSNYPIPKTLFDIACRLENDNGKSIADILSDDEFPIVIKVVSE